MIEIPHDDYWDTDYWYAEYWSEVAEVRSHLNAIDSGRIASLYLDAILKIKGYRDILLDCFCTGLPPCRWSGVYEYLRMTTHTD